MQTVVQQEIRHLKVQVIQNEHIGLETRSEGSQQMNGLIAIKVMMSQGALYIRRLSLLAYG